MLRGRLFVEGALRGRLFVEGALRISADAAIAACRRNLKSHHPQMRICDEPVVCRNRRCPYDNSCPSRRGFPPADANQFPASRVQNSYPPYDAASYNLASCCLSAQERHPSLYPRPLLPPAAQQPHHEPKPESCHLIPLQQAVNIAPNADPHEAPDQGAEVI